MNKEIKEIAELLDTVYDNQVDHDAYEDRIETATALYEAGYRKQSDVAREFADKLNEHLYKKIALDNRVAEKASMVCVSKYHSTISCQSVLDFTNKLAKEFGVEEVENESETL